jgi:tRNA pseudouridine synthase 10
VLEVLQKAEKILRENPAICDWCLGRFFGLKGSELSNNERGRAIKTLLFMEAYQALPRRVDEVLLRCLAKSGYEPAREIVKKVFGEEIERLACSVCGGLTEKYETIARRLFEESRIYEFRTFEVGIRIPPDILRREEDFWLRYSLSSAENLKNEASREIGKAFSRISGKEYSRINPELTIIVDLATGNAEYVPAPLFIYGRYRKLVRGLPQSPWSWPDERMRFNTSVEELISKPAIETFKAEGAKLHAAGREDIDVRTLGNGRPFVLELKRPKVRTVDLKDLQESINQRARGLIEVIDLRYTDRKTLKKLKSLSSIARKKYLARVSFDEPLDDMKLQEISKIFDHAIISQRTPSRVLHRRADRLRKKVVFSVNARKISQTEAEFIIDAQGGFYVKEFIHGDNGRTSPSISEYLGNRVKNIELDVIEIEESFVDAYTSTLPG